MAQSVCTIDLGKIYQGTAASGGGTFTADYPIPTDQVAILQARAILSAASASHLTTAAGIYAEYVVENKNGTLSAPANITSSNNPANTSTTTYVAAHAQAADAGFVGAGPPTITWSISTTNARVTVANPGATSANVTVVIDAIIVGST